MPSLVHRPGMLQSRDEWEHNTLTHSYASLERNVDHVDVGRVFAIVGKPALANITGILTYRSRKRLALELKGEGLWPRRSH